MIYVISDLHGYPQEQFLALLARAGFRQDDFLYILGDVVDRNGDGGVETLVWLLEQPNVQLLLGNHEAMLLSCTFLFQEVTEESLGALTPEQMGMWNTYLQNGGEVTLRALRKLPVETREEVFAYLQEAPLYEAVTAGGRDYLLVHAGIEGFVPGKKLSSYAADDFLWVHPKITDTYFPDILTVFGHTPTGTYGAQYNGKVLKTETWIDIDVGVGFGNEPVLLRLDDLQEFR